MKIGFTNEQRTLQERVRVYMADLLDEPMRQEMAKPDYMEGGGPQFKARLEKMGEDGWLGLGWDKSLGGRGVGPVEQYIFTEEIMASGFPYPFLTVDTVGPMLAQHGNDFLRETVVKEILKGKVIISVGYSEPDAGTDLASLKTCADRHGDDWIINGQKVWTSLGQFADYVWLAARTNHDPAIKKHKGITLFLVPTDSPGFSLTPIHTLGMRTNATYYENIRLPDRYRVGEIDGGWKLITGQLNRERLSIVNPGMLGGLFEDVCQWAATTSTGDEGPVISIPWVKQSLARVQLDLQTLRLLCWKQAWAMQSGNPDMADSSAAKVFGSEFFVETYRRLMEVVGQTSTLKRDSPASVLHGKLEHRYRVGSVLTFGGGTNEIQREIIAGAGLFLPRGR